MAPLLTCGVLASSHTYCEHLCSHYPMTYNCISLYNKTRMRLTAAVLRARIDAHRQNPQQAAAATEEEAAASEEPRL